MSEFLTGIYVLGLFLGLGLSIGLLMVDATYDMSPRKVLIRFLRHLLVCLAWPIGGLVWLFLVLYKDRWDVL